MTSVTPTRATIDATIHKFDSTISVLDLSRSGRPTAVSGNHLDWNPGASTQSPHISVRRLSRDTGASLGTVHESLKAMGYKACVPKLTQELIDDFNRRKEFCFDHWRYELSVSNSLNGWNKISRELECHLAQLSLLVQDRSAWNYIKVCKLS